MHGDVTGALQVCFVTSAGGDNARPQWSSRGPLYLALGLGANHRQDRGRIRAAVDAARLLQCMTMAYFAGQLSMIPMGSAPRMPAWWRSWARAAFPLTRQSHSRRSTVSLRLG